ncbi:MAG: tRNA (adenosine(37)-N6)-dimethylallyltransferase MiaA [Ruminococcaceae bacterium]|nr:tRNA (adenosine(37)-N6)-dimethylallyltransferase MiaA [Oscillospiraceae bacterium]
MSVRAIIITGPTASGKTSCAIKLAHKLDGEIISCDSMQIYKHMDIGTAKPDEAEKEGVPHHLMDFLDPWEEYSVAQYGPDATNAILDVASRGKTPILCGGTGLYVNCLVDNIRYDTLNLDTVKEKNLTDEYTQYACENGPEALHDLLKGWDPQAASEIHYNNVKRVVRACTLYSLTEMTLAERNALSRSEPAPVDYTVYCVDRPRDELYERINLRVDIMMQQGLLDEVYRLLQICHHEGKELSKTARQAIGYKEIFEYMNPDTGKLRTEDISTVADNIKQASRRYAKRQLTWMRKPQWVNWITAEDLLKKYGISD